MITVLYILCNKVAEKKDNVTVIIVFSKRLLVSPIVLSGPTINI